MPAAPPHPRERERLASLRSYRVLPGQSAPGPDAALDALTAAAAAATGFPAAWISVVDHERQWLISTAGVREVAGHPLRDSDRDSSLCAHVVAGERPVVVADASADARFADSALVTGPEHLRAYAGVPVIGRDGLPLGSLCVLDRRPRRLRDDGLALLLGLADAVAELLELRRGDAAAGLGAHRVLAESRDLRAGLDAGQLTVHYQPVVDLPSGRWLGLEALVRWDHPERGLLPPGAFLPLAEGSGLVVPLGRQVLTRACAQVAAWRREFPAAADLHVAVNVSGRQLGEPGIVDVVAGALAAGGLPADALVLELTETALAGSGPEVDATLQRVRALGVALALDDFGTGYASFRYLQRFHPDIVKIDRCFVGALGRSALDDLLARSLVDLGLQLGCDVVAEGVEEHEQARALARLGVRNAQGYLFSEPRDAADVRELLASTGGGLGTSAA
ncbi:sensor domain-containing phosphodiesterase [Kineococcus sp. SYSU DK001]|uniref:sensor domain-containing phosphodiesterase n=1 Tax=Kineococcus sp. SYSU DK001 TaxID=3383122 RepID=UPI003D7EC7EA